MDADYFKVKQPEWIATDGPIRDIKACSITQLGGELLNNRTWSISVYILVCIW